MRGSVQKQSISCDDPEGVLPSSEGVLILKDLEQAISSPYPLSLITFERAISDFEKLAREEREIDDEFAEELKGGELRLFTGYFHEFFPLNITNSVPY